MKAKELSKYVIAKYDFYGEFISNKKLQKFLYYIEAWALVHMESIIDEDFQAWVHGPVIPEVYQEYRHFGYSPLSFEYPNNAPNASKFIENFVAQKVKEGVNPDVFKLIDDVLEEYGELNAFQLERLTHAEDPWLIARKEIPSLAHSNNIIDRQIMKDYYSKVIQEESEE